MRKLDIKIGEKFNRLTVLKEVEPYICPCGKKQRQVLVECECGVIKEVVYFCLKNGNTKSCGCLKKERRGKLNLLYKHGMKGTRFYGIWNNMKKRCSNKNSINYKDYGGRGITICKEWLEFEDFKNDMYESYLKHCDKFTEKNTSIDRTNNDLGYNKQNCCWSDRKKQNNNKRNNILITYKNKTQNIKQWAEYLNINYKALWARIRRDDWSVEKAFNK